MTLANPHPQNPRLPDRVVKAQSKLFSKLMRNTARLRSSLHRSSHILQHLRVGNITQRKENRPKMKKQIYCCSPTAGSLSKS